MVEVSLHLDRIQDQSSTAIIGEDRANMLLETFLQYVLPSLLGAGSGLFAILATRHNWGIEKEREQLKRRRELVDTWRRELLDDWSKWDGLTGMGRLQEQSLRPPHMQAYDRT
jgi:hypothetical protein